MTPSPTLTGEELAQAEKEILAETGWSTRVGIELKIGYELTELLIRKQVELTRKDKELADNQSTTDESIRETALDSQRVHDFVSKLSRDDKNTFNALIKMAQQPAESIRERTAKGITDEDMKIAQENPHFFCYMGSNMPHQHTVGCSHQKWTAEQLQSALTTQMAVVRVLQHKLFGIPLDGKPIIQLSEEFNMSGIPL